MVLASTNRRDAGPRSTPGGPQIPNVFVITLAMMYLYLLQDSYFPPIYRIFFRGAWNLHDWFARSCWSLGQLSVMSRRDNASVGDAMQCSKYSVAPIECIQWVLLMCTFHHSRSEVQARPDKAHRPRSRMAVLPGSSRCSQGHSFPSW